MQVSTSSPTSTGFGQGTLLFGHALRVSALQASVYLNTGLLTYAYMLINILLSSSHEKKEEFYRKRVFLCGSTRFPASIGFYEGTFLFGHALRVSALQLPYTWILDF